MKALKVGRKASKKMGGSVMLLAGLISSSITGATRRIN